MRRANYTVPVSARLRNKIAIVTGAGGGIGRAICLAYADEGAALVCGDIDREGAEETVAQIKARGGRAAAVTGDLARERTSLDLVAAARTEFGGLTTVVNSAIRDVSYLPVTELQLVPGKVAKRKVSSPSTPESVSAPNPPWIVSSPAEPVMVSLPAPPRWLIHARRVIESIR